MEKLLKVLGYVAVIVAFGAMLPVNTGTDETEESESSTETITETAEETTEEETEERKPIEKNDTKDYAVRRGKVFDRYMEKLVESIGSERVMNAPYNVCMGNLIDTKNTIYSIDNIEEDILRTGNPTLSIVGEKCKIGQSIQLTLDADLSYNIYNYLNRSLIETSVAIFEDDGLDLKTRALVSYPSYNANIDDEEYTPSRSERINRAVVPDSLGTMSELLTMPLMAKHGYNYYDDVSESTLYSLGEKRIRKDLNELFWFNEDINCEFSAMDNRIQIIEPGEETEYRSVIKSSPVYLGMIMNAAAGDGTVKVPYICDKILDTVTEEVLEETGYSEELTVIESEYLTEIRNKMLSNASEYEISAGQNKVEYLAAGYGQSDYGEDIQYTAGTITSEDGRRWTIVVKEINAMTDYSGIEILEEITEMLSEQGGGVR